MKLQQSKDELLKRTHSSSSMTNLSDDQILNLFTSNFMKSQENLFNLHALNDDIDKMSKIYAMEYNTAKASQCHDKKSENSFSQSFWVYKMMIMPQDMLVR